MPRESGNGQRHCQHFTHTKTFLSSLHFRHKRTTDENNAHAHLSFVCSTSLTKSHGKLRDKYETPRKDLTHNTKVEEHLTHPVTPRLLQFSPFWPASSVRSLHRIQNCAARLRLKKEVKLNASLLCFNLRWLPIPQRI